MYEPASGPTLPPNADDARNRLTHRRIAITIETFTSARILEFVHLARLCERSEFWIYDQERRPLGSVAAVGSSYQQLKGNRCEVRDHSGTPVLLLTTKAVRFRRVVQVERPHSGHIGEIVQRAGSNLRVCLLTSGLPVGEIIATGRRSREFVLHDGGGSRVGAVVLRREPVSRLVARRYVVRVEFEQRLADPLGTLAVAAIPFLYRAVARRDSPD
jgi:hypothetical protein